MADEQPPAVTILGRGRVGRSLAGALLAAGVPVSLRSSRDERSFADGFADVELVVLAVPDGAIAAVAERVATAVGAAAPRADESGDSGATERALPAVIHLSGASGLEPLAALDAAGIPVGVAHPYYPFPEPRPADAFAGITFGVAATTPTLLDRIERLVTAIGALSRRVDADGWVAYHVSGVLASNYLTVLAAQAAELLERAGFDRDAATDALVPLIRGALDNLEAEGVDNALSGPLRRGDVGTVDRHLAWLDAHAPEIAATYRVLARPGIDLAVGTGLDDHAAEQLRRSVES